MRKVLASLFAMTKISILVTMARCLSIIPQLKAGDTKVSQKMKLSNFQSKSKKMEDIER